MEQLFVASYERIPSNYLLAIKVSAVIRALAFRLMQSILIAKRNRIIGAHLPATARRIADVGCGHFPNRYANVAMDSPGNSDVQRGGLPVAGDVGVREYFSVDLNEFPYPFADKEFDYVICTHVLEHLDDPVRACLELTRIAKSGYVEVPFLYADVFVRNNDPIHKWLCLFSSAEQKISFVPRDTWISRYPAPPLGLMMRFLLQLDNISLTWNDSLVARYGDLHIDYFECSESRSIAAPNLPESENTK
jgi:SAM-dependent methyltransferase